MSTRRAGAIAFGAGLVLSTAYPELDLAPLAWVAIAPLYTLCTDGGPRRGALVGSAFGLGFFGSLLAWVSLVGYVAWILTVLLQVAYLAAFGALWAVIGRDRRVLVRVGLFASLWVAVEAARAFTPVVGFTWGELSQGQHNLEWMLRPAAIGGGWLVAWLVAIANGLVGEGWRLAQARRFTRAGIAVAIAGAVVGAPALLPRADASGQALRVGIVQGNVPTEIPRGFDREVAILASHRDLTIGLAGANLDLIVWPESSVGLDADNAPEAVAAIGEAARAVGVPMIVGGNLDEGPGHYMVMAFSVGPDGSIVDRYQKTHLVPFGEYVPGRSWLGWVPILDQVPRDAIAGDEPRFFDIDGAPIATVISFEGDFGSIVRKPIARGGRALIVATNTSTWGNSSASAQHVAFSQVRAAENRVWVTHAALSGISAFIKPDGTVVKRSPLWTPTTLVQEIRLAEGTTFYTKTGDWVPLGAAVACLLGLGAAWRRRRPDTVA